MMGKSPEMGIGLGVVILVVVCLLAQSTWWNGVSSAASNVTTDQSSTERINSPQDGKNAGSRSCCCTRTGTEDTTTISQNERIKRLVYEEYARKLDDPAITVEVNDLGCHIEALVMKDGKAIKHLSVSEGVIQEMD